jgi:hypothetical protein
MTRNDSGGLTSFKLQMDCGLGTPMQICVFRLRSSRPLAVVKCDWRSATPWAAGESGRPSWRSKSREKDESGKGLETRSTMTYYRRQKKTRTCCFSSEFLRRAASVSGVFGLAQNHWWTEAAMVEFWAWIRTAWWRRWGDARGKIVRGIYRIIWMRRGVVLARH